MKNNLTVELCPETGLCSIVRESGVKIDLLPDEVEAIRAAATDSAQIKDVLTESDSTFASQLTADELEYIGRRLA